MNYMELMNRYWTIKDEANFSNNETVLYFALLDLANKFHWEKEELSYPMEFLCVKANCSKKVLLSSREKLQKYGLIEVKKGYKNARAAVIKIMHAPQAEGNQSGNRANPPQSADNALYNSVTTPERNKVEPESNTETETEKRINTSPYKRQYKEKDKEKTRYSSSSTRFVESHRSPPASEIQFTIEEEERYGEIFKNYNNICHSLSRPYKLTTERKLAIKGLTSHLGTLDDWKGYFFKLASTPFISGEGNGWKADFDWILREENFFKVMEGRFYKKTPVKSEEEIPEELLGFDDSELILQLCRQGR